MNGNNIVIANKIITSEDLFAMFQLMNNNVKKIQRIYEEEKINNEKYEYSKQIWTVGNLYVNQHMSVSFHDNSKINYDNYDRFMSVLSERIEDVNFIFYSTNISYSIIKDGVSHNISQGISLVTFEDKFEIHLDTSSEDDRITDIYNEIMAIIDNAPEKYDRVIKRRNYITNKMGVGIGLIFSIILCTAVLGVSTIKDLYVSNIYIYPTATFIIGLILGVTFFSSLFKGLYKNIIPRRQYIGYNQSRNSGIYKDDLNDYKQKCEILIGRNTDNLKKRISILDRESFFSVLILVELGVIVVTTIIISFMQK